MKQVRHSLKNKSHHDMERETHDEGTYFFHTFSQPPVHVSHSTTILCLPEKLSLTHSTCIGLSLNIGKAVTKKDSMQKHPLPEGARGLFCIELSIDTISHNKIQIAGYKGHDTIMIIFFETVVIMRSALSIRTVQLTVHDNSQIKYTPTLNSH